MRRLNLLLAGRRANMHGIMPPKPPWVPATDDRLPPVALLRVEVRAVRGAVAQGWCYSPYLPIAMYSKRYGLEVITHLSAAQ